MNIKERKLRLNPSIFLFNRQYSNGLFLIYIVFNLILLLAYMKGADISSLGISVVTIIIWCVGLLLVAIDGVFDASRSRYKENISDFKKSLLYLTIILSSLIMYYNANKVEIKIPNNQSIKIYAIQTYEIHKADKDSYAIKYFDKDSNQVWYDSYEEESKRNKLFNSYFNNDGSVRVEIIYKVENGNRYLEVLDKKKSIL